LMTRLRSDPAFETELVLTTTMKAKLER